MKTVREAAVLRQIRWRILPLLFAGYFAAYIDRVNVGFAALTMNQALGLTAAQYGLGGGLFFAGYVAFGVPSNLVLARLGARLGFPHHGVLGAGVPAECLGHRACQFLCHPSCPGRGRGRALSRPALCPDRMAAGALSRAHDHASGFVHAGLDHAGLADFPADPAHGRRGGLAGWQWLFVLQALPTIALALVFYLAMPDSPATARWLTAENRQWLVEQLAREREKREQVGRFSVKDALTNPTVWLIAHCRRRHQFAAYGLILFLPQMIHALGVSTALTPLVNAIPFAVCAVVMVLWSNHSDRSMERNWHAAIPAAVAGLALIACPFLQNPVLTLVALTPRHHRHLLLRLDFLGGALGHADGRGGGGGPCADQLGCQCRQLCRALCAGLGEGCDRQFFARHRGAGIGAADWRR